MPFTVFNRYGQRKYLTSEEIDAFIRQARNCRIEVRAFCWMMAYTGCRISEALAITRDSIDFETKHVIIKCLKKRGKRMFRAIPLPPALLKLLYKWFTTGQVGRDRLWPWSRMTGYRRICEVMDGARILGSYASPKGLRHGFGVRAIQASVPLTLVQRWLGHADIKTTAIYTSAMGPEERAIASRMWKGRTACDSPKKSPERHSALWDYTPSAMKTADVDIAEDRDLPLPQIARNSAPLPPLIVLSRPHKFSIDRDEAGRTESRNLIFSCSLIHYWLQCRRIYHAFSML